MSHDSCGLDPFSPLGHGLAKLIIITLDSSLELLHSYQSCDSFDHNAWNAYPYSQTGFQSNWTTIQRAITCRTIRFQCQAAGSNIHAWPPFQWRFRQIASQFILKSNAWNTMSPDPSASSELARARNLVPYRKWHSHAFHIQTTCFMDHSTLRLSIITKLVIASWPLTALLTSAFNQFTLWLLNTLSSNIPNHLLPNTLKLYFWPSLPWRHVRLAVHIVTAKHSIIQYYKPAVAKHIEAFLLTFLAKTTCYEITEFKLVIEIISSILKAPWTKAVITTPSLSSPSPPCANPPLSLFVYSSWLIYARYRPSLASLLPKQDLRYLFSITKVTYFSSFASYLDCYHSCFFLRDIKGVTIRLLRPHTICWEADSDVSWRSSTVSHLSWIVITHSHIFSLDHLLYMLSTSKEKLHPTTIMHDVAVKQFFMFCCWLVNNSQDWFLLCSRKMQRDTWTTRHLGK
jgi:hypothetical protein